MFTKVRKGGTVEGAGGVFSADDEALLQFACEHAAKVLQGVQQLQRTRRDLDSTRRQFRRARRNSGARQALTRAVAAETPSVLVRIGSAPCPRIAGIHTLGR